MNEALEKIGEVAGAASTTVAEKGSEAVSETAEKTAELAKEAPVSPENQALQKIDGDYGNVLEIKDEVSLMEANARQTSTQLDAVRKDLGMATSGEMSSPMLTGALNRLSSAEMQLQTLEKRFLMIPEGSPAEVKVYKMAFGSESDIQSEFAIFIREAQEDVVEARKKFVESYIEKILKSLLSLFLPVFEESKNDKKAEKIFAMRLERTIFHRAETFITTGEKVGEIAGGVSFALERYGADNGVSDYFIDDVKVVAGEESKQIDWSGAQPQIEDVKPAPAGNLAEQAPEGPKQIGMGESAPVASKE